MAHYGDRVTAEVILGEHPPKGIVTKKEILFDDGKALDDDSKNGI